MSEDCKRCESRATTAKMEALRRETLSASEWNRELLSNLFDCVYDTMCTGRGDNGARYTGQYLTADHVHTVVSSTLKKVEMDALNAWRTEKGG